MTNIKIFEDRKIRTAWNADNEEWYFSVVDVIAVLTDSPRPRKYWNALKTKLAHEGSQLSHNVGQLKMPAENELSHNMGQLKSEGSELATICSQLKMPAEDGKMRETDVLDTRGILRLIQSVPSKKAEPFKMWLAEVGNDRLNEIADPEKAIMRGAEFYRKKGYPEGWINQRLQTIEMRKELTDEWQRRGITQEKDYAILTDEMTKAWSGLSIKKYKELKNLKKENLRDNMTNIELVLNMLAEVTTTNISISQEPAGFEQSKKIAREGGEVAGIAKKEFEKRTGKKAVSAINAKNKKLLEITEKSSGKRGKKK